MSVQAEHQAVLDALACAGGRALSFAELEALGVSRPAMVVYELEAAGCPVERVFEIGENGHRHLVGVRGPRWAPGPAAEVQARPGRRLLPRHKRAEARV